MADTQPSMSMENVLALVAQMNKENRDAFLEAVKELRKPTATEQKKLDDEAAKLKRSQDERVEMAKVEEERKRLNASSCPHATFHPGTGVSKHLWRAQVHAPRGKEPYFIPICTRCSTQLPAIKCTTDMLQNGVGLDQYAAINEETLRKWADRTPGNVEYAKVG